MNATWIIILAAIAIGITFLILGVLHSHAANSRRTTLTFWKWVVNGFPGISGKKKTTTSQEEALSEQLALPPPNSNPIVNSKPKKSILQKMGNWLSNFFTLLFLGSPENRKKREARKDKREADKADMRRIKREHKERILAIRAQEKKAKAERTHEAQKKKQERKLNRPPTPSLWQRFNKWLDRLEKRRDERRRERRVLRSERILRGEPVGFKRQLLAFKRFLYLDVLEKNIKEWLEQAKKRREARREEERLQREEDEKSGVIVTNNQKNWNLRLSMLFVALTVVGNWWLISGVTTKTLLPESDEVIKKTHYVFLIALVIFDAIITFVALESIKIPKPGTLQVILFINKPYRVIANIDSMGVDKKTNDLVGGGPKRRKWYKFNINVYWFVWPLFKTHSRTIKKKTIVNIGRELPGDIVISKNDVTKTVLVSRDVKVNYIPWREERPTFTSNLETEDLNAVNLSTDNIVEAVNGIKMFFDIDDYVDFMERGLEGALRGVVAGQKLLKLNEFRSEEKATFNEAMQKVNEDTRKENGEVAAPGFKRFGFKLIKAVFGDFEPSNEQTRLVMKSYSDVVLNEQKGKAALELQKGVTQAFINKTNAEIEQERKKRLQTGTAVLADKTKPDGELVLVPDANVKTTMDNIGGLKDLKGTLVMDGSITKMLNIPTTKEKGGANE